ncbi:hypothetical protein Tco_0249330, partial [Tanacetum coccineum]
MLVKPVTRYVYLKSFEGNKLIITVTTTTTWATDLLCDGVQQWLSLDGKLHLVNGLLWKTNDESGTPRSQSGWKTSWSKKDDKEDQCASR